MSRPLQTLRDRRANDAGFTLVELLIVMLLMVIVLAAVGGLMISLITTPKIVTSRLDAANTGQLAATSINQGIRNSSDFRLTNPTGNDQLLVARTAQSGAVITWVCSAWYFSATNGTIRYTQSPSAIPLLPTSTDLASWTLLVSGVSPSTGTGIFTATGQTLMAAFKVAVSGQTNPQTITTSVFNRAGSTGSPACY